MDNLLKIDAAAIESGALVEDETFDFKRQVNLDDQQGKSRFVDDVVAFLNRGAAHIVVGVREEGGRFAEYAPMTGNSEQFEHKVLSIIQTGIDPLPIHAKVHTIEVPGGWIADVNLPKHSNGPFQSRLSGAFLIRTGSKNTPIPRHQLEALIVDEERWLSELGRLSESEADSISTGERMTPKGPCLQIGILPRQHFDRSIPMFTQGPHWRKSAPVFGDSGGGFFQGCEDGNEAFAIGGDGKGFARLYIRDDWFVHAYVAWPIWEAAGEERLTFHEFRTDLPGYLSQLDELFAEMEIAGPFAITMSLDLLQRDPKVGRYFRGAASRVRMVRPQIVSKLDDEDLSGQFLAKVHRTTIFG